jgi:simple sugar transport system ATP-binding protein
MSNVMRHSDVGMSSTSQSPAEYAVEMKSISKSFQRVIANDRIDFDARLGEVHGLVGENGAGKTTLMCILSGLYQPDKGEIFLGGKKVEIRSPQDSLRARTGMVYQTFSLAPSLSVAENICLGLKSPASLLRLKDTKKEIVDLSRKYGMDVDPDAIVEKLPLGLQQRVEILKLLYRGADILIFDEPTSVLTTQEISEFMKVLRGFAKMGKTVIFITHKLHEVMGVCDRVTVLRQGRKVATVSPTDVSQLARLMIGERDLPRVTKTIGKEGDVILELKNVCCHNQEGSPILKNISLYVKSGEILGIAGVEGNGQEELGECIVGFREMTRGAILINGVEMKRRTQRNVYCQHISFIPPDKRGIGTGLNLSLVENAILRDFNRPPVKNGILINYSAAEQIARTIVNSFEVVSSDIKSPVEILSGGNLCKMVVGREILRNTKLLVAVNPTACLDVKTTHLVHSRLLEKKTGTAILLISMDIDEILTLSDRVAVIYRGEIMGELPIEKADQHIVGLMMGGSKLEDIRDRKSKKHLHH